MSSKSYFNVTGLNLVDKRLKELTTNAKKEIRKAQRRNLKPIQKAAKDLAPKDSGKLRKAIKIRAGKRSRVKIHTYVRLMWDIEELPIPYPVYMEYGTPDIPPKAFIRRAYDSGQNTAKETTIREIEQFVTKESRRLGL